MNANILKYEKIAIIAIVALISSLGIATIAPMMLIANAARHSENTCDLNDNLIRQQAMEELKEN